MDAALIQLTRRMWSVNPTWGSPRIRDELAKLGLEASTATIRKYHPKSRCQPSQSWRTFLRNHAGVIAAMDFFVVPTVTFRLLYALVIITQEARNVLLPIVDKFPRGYWHHLTQFHYKRCSIFLFRLRVNDRLPLALNRLDAIRQAVHFLRADVDGVINRR
jgi:hypothetical protein